MLQAASAVEARTNEVHEAMVRRRILAAGIFHQEKPARNRAKMPTILGVFVTRSFGFALLRRLV